MNVFSNPISNFKQVESVEIDSKQNEIRYGDIFFTTSSETPEEVGMSSIWLENKGNYYLNSFCFGFRPSMKFDPYFAAYMLRTSNVRNKITLLAQGISRYNISKNQMMNIEVPFPKDSEQIKLGKLFVKIDNLITLHQRKCNCFSNSWEQRKLGEISNIVGGGTPSTEVESYWNGNINWYSPAEIGSQIYVSNSQRKITELGLEKSSARLLPVGTVLFTSRAGIGNMAILKEKACTNQGFQSIIPIQNKLNSYFIFSRSNELKKYAETVGSGSTFVEVSGKQMSEMEIKIPQIKEQVKISDLFTNLDNLITLHQRKQEKLNELKKSMLDKMFI